MMKKVLWKINNFFYLLDFGDKASLVKNAKANGPYKEIDFDF